MYLPGLASLQTTDDMQVRQGRVSLCHHDKALSLAAGATVPCRLQLSRGIMSHVSKKRRTAGTLHPAVETLRSELSAQRLTLAATREFVAANAPDEAKRKELRAFIATNFLQLQKDIIAAAQATHCVACMYLLASVGVDTSCFENLNGALADLMQYYLIGDASDEYLRVLVKLLLGMRTRLVVQTIHG